MFTINALDSTYQVTYTTPAAGVVLYYVKEIRKQKTSDATISTAEYPALRSFWRGGWIRYRSWIGRRIWRTRIWWIGIGWRRRLVLPTSNVLFLLTNLLRGAIYEENNKYDQISTAQKMIYDKLISAVFVSYNNKRISLYIYYEITNPSYIK